MLSSRRNTRRHLSERDLLAAWHGDHPSAHLADCATCSARYAALASFLEGRRDDAIDAADAAFPPERLAAQTSHVRRRLENLSRPVRVLTFPVPQRVAPIVGRVGRRWVALAAAVGLIIGLAAGVAVDFHPFGADFAERMGRAPAAAEGTVASDRGAAIARTADDRLQSDEAFLNELEVAADAPHVRELRAIDALTPNVREVAARTR